MGANKYTRVGDFTDDEEAAKGGRSEQDSAQLDAEFDAIKTTTDAHANDLDVLLRDDGKMQDDLLEGHEFSGAAVSVLKGLVGNQNAALTWRGDWVTATDYEVGDLVHEAGQAYICIIAHRSATFATELAAGNWDVFAEKGAGASFPGGATADDVLITNGATENWGKIAAVNTDNSFAPKASPALTGTATAVNLTTSGVLTVDNVTSGVTDKGTSAAVTIDFGGPSLQKVNWSTATGAVSIATTGRKAGVRIELYIMAHASSDRNLTMAESWDWVGFKPTTVQATRDAVLTLLCFGTATTDVVACWAES